MPVESVVGSRGILSSALIIGANIIGTIFSITYAPSGKDLNHFDQQTPIGFELTGSFEGMAIIIPLVLLRKGPNAYLLLGLSIALLDRAFADPWTSLIRISLAVGSDGPASSMGHSRARFSFAHGSFFFRSTLPAKFLGSRTSSPIAHFARMHSRS